MIKITISKEEDKILAFTVSGHANFANKGEDIVCAGVSAVTFGAVNAILSLTNLRPNIEQGESGFLQVTMPESTNSEEDAKAQILLKGMVVSLETITREYKDYVEISFAT